MDDVWTDFIAVLINIVQIKILSNSTVELYCYHGILFTVYVLGLDINLWSVECSLAIGSTKGTFSSIRMLRRTSCVEFQYSSSPKYFSVFFGSHFERRYVTSFSSPSYLKDISVKIEACLELLLTLVRTDNIVTL